MECREQTYRGITKNITAEEAFRYPFRSVNSGYEVFKLDKHHEIVESLINDTFYIALKVGHTYAYDQVERTSDVYG